MIKHVFVFKNQLDWSLFILSHVTDNKRFYKKTAFENLSHEKGCKQKLRQNSTKKNSENAFRLGNGQRLWKPPKIQSMDMQSCKENPGL